MQIGGYCEQLETIENWPWELQHDAFDSLDNINSKKEKDKFMQNA